MARVVRPIPGTHYFNIDQTVQVERVFRLFLRVSVKWNDRLWPANINNQEWLTPVLNAGEFYNYIDPKEDLASYFTIGDEFLIEEIVACTNPKAKADFNVHSCKCTYLVPRLENEIGILFSNFGDRMAQYFGPDVDEQPGAGVTFGRQKKIFVCCESLGKTVYVQTRNYGSNHCMGFESHFPQCDVDKFSSDVEEDEFNDESDVERVPGLRYRARCGQIVKMDVGCPENRKFPVMAYGQVMSQEEVEEYRLPSVDEEDSLLGKFVPLCKNLVYFQSEQERFMTKKMRIPDRVQMVFACFEGHDRLPLHGYFEYPIRSGAQEGHFKPTVGSDLHFRMWLTDNGSSIKEFVGTVGRVQIIRGDKVRVDVNFSSRSALDLILANCVQRANYGVEVRQRFDASSYKLVIRILDQELPQYLGHDYFNLRYPPKGRDKVLLMIICCEKENPQVGTHDQPEPIHAPGIPPMNQPGQLMAIQAIFGEKRCLTCIEGPWGTGKTLSVVSIAYKWVKENPGKVFMICAETNLIVDHITQMLGKVQEELESDGQHILRICRSYANRHSAEKGNPTTSRYAPWILAQNPDERETDAMKALQVKIFERSNQLHDIEVTTQDRHGSGKDLKIKIMQVLVKLIESVYKPKLRMLWLLRLNPNIILCTISHGLVFHYGVRLGDEAALLEKLDELYGKFDSETLEEIKDEDGILDEVQLRNVEDEPEQDDRDIESIDPVEEEFNRTVSRRFQGIICDESGQILQSVAICLCLLLDSEDPDVQMVLVGDRFQLGPHTMAICGGHAQRLLKLSILQVLVDEQVCAFVQFCHTFRSHPAIVEFLKDNVYGTDLQLVSMVHPSERQLLVNTPHLVNLLAEVDGVTAPILFFNYYHEEQPGAGKSMMNYGEADIAIVILEYLVYKNQIPLSKIMILTMYESQNKLIKQRLLNSRVRLVQDDLVKDVDVRNVDGSQGQENDVILLLTTRSNDTGTIGFLEDPHRANVALSRGRHGLIIFGNADTLSSDVNLWGPLVNKYAQDGCMYEVERTENLLTLEAVSVIRVDLEYKKKERFLLSVR